MGYPGWRPSRRDQVHAKGVLVAKPTAEDGCWGTVAWEGAIARTAPRSCRHSHRGDLLTCRAHGALEAAAQKLWAELEAP